VDPAGRRQPLLATYRPGPLRAALHAGDGDSLAGRSLRAVLAGRSLRAVLAGLRIGSVAVTAQEAFDLDTPADLDTVLESGP
jgi:hypothetical protein